MSNSKQKSKNDPVHNLMLNMAQQVLDLNAGDGHAVMNNIKHTKNLTGVVSVYNNQKPDHMILNELTEWCEVNGHGEIITKIKELASDMSWNDNNPV